MESALDAVEAPQARGRDDAIELVTARLGDPDPLLSERDRFVELTEVAERQREPDPRSDEDHGRAQPDPPPPEPCERFPDVAGFSFLLLPGVIPAARIVEAREPRTQRVDDPAEQVASLPKVAELVKRHAEAVARDHLQIELAEVRRDRERASTGLEPTVEIERRSRMDALQRENPSQPAAILEGRREILRSAQRVLELLDLSQCRERRLQLELQIDRPGDRVALGQMRDRRQRLLEAADRLTVGRAARRAGSRLTKVRHRLGPCLAAQGVVSESVDLLGQSIGVFPLD